MSSKKIESVEKKAKEELEKISNDAKKGIKEVGASFKNTQLKLIALSILSFVFPIGGLMLYFELRTEKTTPKNAKIYLILALAGTVLWIIARILGLFTKLILF